jgi:hypothetical protein
MDTGARHERVGTWAASPHALACLLDRVAQLRDTVADEEVGVELADQAL